MTRDEYFIKQRTEYNWDNVNKNVFQVCLVILIMGFLISFINSAVIMIVSGALIYYFLIRYIFGIKILSQLKNFYKY